MRKVIQILAIAAVMCAVLPAQSHAQSNQLWAQRSFDMGVTDRGFTAGATWKHNWTDSWRTPVQFAFLFYRESDKIPRYDYFTGRYYEPPSKKLVFLNMRTGIERRLWTNSLAENLQPHLVMSLGPTLAFNPADDGPFFKRWKKTTFDATAHLFVGAVIDFVYSRESHFSVGVGYEAIYFPDVVNGTDNYSGVSVTLSFGERL